MVLVTTLLVKLCDGKELDCLPVSRNRMNSTEIYKAAKPPLFRVSVINPELNEKPTINVP